MAVWDSPQNFKFRKYSKRFIYGRHRAKEFRTTSLLWGSCCGLVAVGGGKLTPKQLQNALMVLNKGLALKRIDRHRLTCSVGIRAPITQKPLGARMGRGKGGVNMWITCVLPGRMLFQFFGPKCTRQTFLAFKRVTYKLPFLTRIVIEPVGIGRQYSKLFRKC